MTKFKIEIKLKFEHIEELLIGGQATYRLEVIDPSVIKTQLNMESLTKQSILGNLPYIEGDVPPQVLNASEEKQF